MSKPVDKMIATLKKELRSKGLRYRDIASRLRVSETTIKRHLSGIGITIDALQKLAQIVDLDLLSLAALAQQQAESGSQLNKAQQAALGKNRTNRAVFFFLLRGLSPQQIASEFEIGDMDVVLDRLSALGLIRRSAKGRVTILVKPQFGERGGGEMANLMVDGARQFFAEVNILDEKCEWMYYGVRLHRSSAPRLQELIKSFMNDIRALGVTEPAVPSQEVQWYRVFVGAMPVDRQKVFRKN